MDLQPLLVNFPPTTKKPLKSDRFWSAVDFTRLIHLKRSMGKAFRIGLSKIRARYWQ